MLINTCFRLTSCARSTCLQVSRVSCIVAVGSRSISHASAKGSNDETGPTVAIIGSGPAGFYTAQKLMRQVSGTRIDMYEQLPVPFGLVRFGVAPDHPEVKVRSSISPLAHFLTPLQNVQDAFQDVAASPNFTFIGNVNLGHDLPLPLLGKHYDAIVFAYGASKDRKIGLDGEDKSHIYSARAFVGWYNGLPEYRDLKPDLQAGDTAVVVGQGNVALDVARTLLSKVEILRKTDITEYALETLAASKIRHVHVVGRRGPMQAAFTIKEVRELLHLEDVNFTPIPNDLFPSDISKLPRPKKRLMELLRKGSSVRDNATKSWSLDFLLAPKALEYSESHPDRLETITFSRTKLENLEDPESKVTSTVETQSIPATTLFRSIGYKAEAIPGMAELGADFDEQKGTIQHDGLGRIIPLQDTNTKGLQASLYCSGWVKRGPTGVIASTMTDAFQTAEAIVQDWRSKTSESSPTSASSLPQAGWKGVQADAKVLKLPLNAIHWNNWQSIDQAEKKLGLEKGKPREKFGSVGEMLEASG